MDIARLHPHSWSFRSRLTAGIAFVVVATLSGVTLITAQRARTEITRQIGENFQAGAESLSHLVGSFLLRQVGQIQTLAVSPSLRQALAERNAAYGGDAEANAAELRRLDAKWVAAADDDPLIRRVTASDPARNPVAAQLAAFLEAFPAHSELFATDRHGGTVGATGRLSDYWQADEDWWQAAWAGGRGAAYVSTPRFDESAGVNALLVAVPVLDRSGGEVIGILRSTLVVDELFRLLASVTYGRTGRAALLDGSGEIFFDPLHERVDAPGVAPRLHSRIAGGAARTGVMRDSLGSDWIFALARLRAPAVSGGRTSPPEEQILEAVGDPGWIVVVQQRVDEALVGVDSLTRRIFAAGLVALVLATFVATWLARSVAQPLHRLRVAAEEIGRGNLDARLPEVSNDEIGRLSRSFATMTTRLRELIGKLSARSDELSRANGFLEQHSLEMGLLGEMSSLLQSCSAADEAYRVIASFAPRILPVLAGSVSVIRDSRDRLTTVAAWGGSEGQIEEKVFKPKECWALRRGQLHQVDTPGSDMLCDHLSPSLDEGPHRLMCVPMMAQGETLGVLHLCWDASEAGAGRAGEPPESAQPGPEVASAVADQIGLALSNLKLQESLRHQAIRDPLTGLFNRRYMEESLDREIVRANRKSTPLGILMLDIDHFKRFNDSFGHDAGDRVLEELSKCLLDGTRGEDVVCRYGGEEFAIILPETALRDAARRAQELLEKARRLDLRLRGISLGAITVSAGVAVFPDHGLSGRDLLRAADVALYRAKNLGRDRMLALEKTRS